MGTRDRAHKELVAESHKHTVTQQLETCPGVGEIRAAQIVSVVVTPERFRTRQQFWSYCGLGIVMRSSSDWMQTPKGVWVRTHVAQTRGLNRNHNTVLKNVFKGAATTVIQQYPDDPLHKDYQRLLATGTKPNLAKLTLARKIAAITLAMWQEKGGLRAPQDIESIACLFECDGDARQVHADRSRSTQETSRNRRRASIERLDEAHRRARRSEVPTTRLCPSGEPNEAMAHRGPDSRVVPAFAAEQQGFDVLRVANERHDLEKRTPNVSVDTFVDHDAIDQVRATLRAFARLEANARHQEMDRGWAEKFFLDVSSHSRRCKG